MPSARLGLARAPVLARLYPAVSLSRPRRSSVTRLSARARFSLRSLGLAPPRRAKLSRDEPSRIAPRRHSRRADALFRKCARARPTRSSLFFHAVSAGLSSTLSPVAIYPSPFLTLLLLFLTPVAARYRPFGPLCGTSVLFRRNPPSSLSSLRHFAHLPADSTKICLRRVCARLHRNGSVSRWTICLLTGTFRKSNATRGTERYFSSKIKRVRPAVTSAIA